MKIKAHKKELEKAFKKVVPACLNKGTLEVLKGVYFANDVLLATNLDTGIKTSYDAEIVEKGKAVLPGRKLLNIVKSLPNEQVKISVNDYNATIQSNGVEFNLAGYRPDEFPGFPEMEEGNRMEITGQKLKETIDKTIMSVSQDDSQPSITAICFEEGYATATNTYRLANVSTELEFDRQLLLPQEAAKEVKKIYKNEMTVEYSDSFMRFTSGNTMLITRLIEGQFPNWRQVIPNSYSTTVTVEKDKLIKAVKRANIVAHETSGEILLSVGEGLQMSAESDENEVNQELEAEVDGGELNIKIDAGYMLDGLKRLAKDTVQIELENELSPLVINENNFTYVVMPIRQD